MTRTRVIDRNISFEGSNLAEDGNERMFGEGERGDRRVNK